MSRSVILDDFIILKLRPVIFATHHVYSALELRISAPFVADWSSHSTLIISVKARVHPVSSMTLRQTSAKNVQRLVIPVATRSPLVQAVTKMGQTPSFSWASVYRIAHPWSACKWVRSVCSATLPARLVRGLRTLARHVRSIWSLTLLTMCVQRSASQTLRSTILSSKLVTLAMTIVLLAKETLISALHASQALY